MPFKKFNDTLTAYRQTALLLAGHKVGVYEAIGKSGAGAKEIKEKTGTSLNSMTRLLDALVGIEILERKNNIYYLTQPQYLLKDSPSSQIPVLEFEEKLMKSWTELDITIKSGMKNFEVKSDEEYKQDLNTFLGAMNSAAHVRSRELWDTVDAHKKEGTIIDLGGGSGKYLERFLKKNRLWRGIYIDIKEACEYAEKRLEDKKLCIDYHNINLAESEVGGIQGDIILASNFIHCQNFEDNMKILANIKPLFKNDSIIIIHDFFKENMTGRLYDAHMMANTYNGRTYSFMDAERMLENSGFNVKRAYSLESGSYAVVAGI